MQQLHLSGCAEQALGAHATLWPHRHAISVLNSLLASSVLAARCGLCAAAWQVVKTARPGVAN